MKEQVYKNEFSGKFSRIRFPKQFTSKIFQKKTTFRKRKTIEWHFDGKNPESSFSG